VTNAFVKIVLLDVRIWRMVRMVVNSAPFLFGGKIPFLLYVLFVQFQRRFGLY